MKKIVFLLLGFIALTFLLLIHSSKVYAQVGDVDELLNVINKVGDELKPNTESTQEEQAKKIEEEERKKLANELEKPPQRCDFPGATCCVSKAPPNSSIPLQNKVANTDQLPTTDKPNDPLSPVWCEYDSHVPTRHLVPNTFDPLKCTCEEVTTSLEKICARVSPNEQRACGECSSNNGVWTALGCVDSTLAGFIKNTLLGWGIGLAGVIAMLCIIYSAFVLQTSSGNPEKIKKAKERLTACIVGLLLIIFSVFILKLVGVDILQIPGFGV